jgi:hypothetical protein
MITSMDIMPYTFLRCLLTVVCLKIYTSVFTVYRFLPPIIFGCKSVYFVNNPRSDYSNLGLPENWYTPIPCGILQN